MLRAEACYWLQIDPGRYVLRSSLYFENATGCFHIAIGNILVVIYFQTVSLRRLDMGVRLSIQG